VAEVELVLSVEMLLELLVAQAELEIVLIHPGHQSLELAYLMCMQVAAAEVLEKIQEQEV
jgi:hypothetical protein